MSTYYFLYFFIDFVFLSFLHNHFFVQPRVFSLSVFSWSLIHSVTFFCFPSSVFLFSPCLFSPGFAFSFCFFIFLYFFYYIFFLSFPIFIHQTYVRFLLLIQFSSLIISSFFLLSFLCFLSSSLCVFFLVLAFIGFTYHASIHLMGKWHISRPKQPYRLIVTYR